MSCGNTAKVYIGANLELSVMIYGEQYFKMILIQLKYIASKISQSQTRNNFYYYCSLTCADRNRYHATYCIIALDKIARESINTLSRGRSSISVSRSIRK